MVWVKWSAINQYMSVENWWDPPPFIQSLFFIDCKVSVLNENAPILGPQSHTLAGFSCLWRSWNPQATALCMKMRSQGFLLPRFLFLAPNRSVHTQQMAF